jgi:hypothetical protein
MIEERVMKSAVHQFACVSDAIYDGRTELGYSIENDAAGYDAFVGGEFIGSFPTRAEARAAILAARRETTP